MDTFDPATRSRVMASVKSSGTGLETKFLALLAGAGISGFETQATGLPGKPDVIFAEKRIAVFVDSCFWHGCPLHLRRPSSNSDYWNAKINRNVARDRKKRAELRKSGWKVVRVWEHEMKFPAKVVAKIRRSLRMATK